MPTHAALSRSRRLWHRRSLGSRLPCRRAATASGTPSAAAAPLQQVVTDAPAASAGAGGNGNGAAPSTQRSALTFQEAIARLQEYWASVGCAVTLPFNSEVGKHLEDHASSTSKSNPACQP